MFTFVAVQRDWIIGKAFRFENSPGLQRKSSGQVVLK